MVRRRHCSCSYAYQLAQGNVGEHGTRRATQIHGCSWTTCFYSHHVDSHRSQCFSHFRTRFHSHGRSLWRFHVYGRVCSRWNAGTKLFYFSLDRFFFFPEYKYLNLFSKKFFQRLLILFMPAKYQPDEPYLRHVSTSRVHLFTVIQLISTSGLYAIKYIESVAIAFPILVGLYQCYTFLIYWNFNE